MAKQIRTHTHEHGRVYAQAEQFGGRLHLALQPVDGGPAHRFPLDDPETDQLLEDYPDLRQVLDDDEEEPTRQAPARRKPDKAEA